MTEKESIIKITKEMLRKDIPPVVHKDGFVSIVLAVWKDSNYGPTNTYIPKWMICNTEYYANHASEFEGWIDLEFLLPPIFP